MVGTVGPSTSEPMVRSLFPPAASPQRTVWPSAFGPSRPVWRIPVMVSLLALASYVPSSVEPGDEKSNPNGRAEFLRWIGGYFETFYSVNPHWKADVTSLPNHPVANGVHPFSTKDESRNLTWLALPTLGEAWHNNHHAFPTSAEHGLRRRQLDPSALVIGVLERLGLVWDVVRVSPERQQSRAA